ncbi:PTS lactose/cellobiose transporter subunit IIA [Lacticaseibacillus pantheris]|uniref:PTS lactose/cellobiose transporter subunit IIA n=1 Tax=Lacticaseibacillus pantheris TaxID=171523 RepID=UPI0026580FD3|nr:PTS lactose/cellobiose transporter subunit IIA [Lacticaseibacillus pantheris]WKF85581.1 PTS lactose/cellobiose transporter subunit IIA [Lacticaseibacillus pantheris]
MARNSSGRGGGGSGRWGCRGVLRLGGPLHGDRYLQDSTEVRVNSQQRTGNTMTKAGAFFAFSAASRYNNKNAFFDNTQYVQQAQDAHTHLLTLEAPAELPQVKLLLVHAES